MVPEILCQTQLIAQGSTAKGWLTKKLAANTVASPAFCIPTSIEIVRFLAILKCASTPEHHPKR